MAALSEAQVLALETRLVHAMHHSSLAELDELLADDLMFTDHLGSHWRKQDDLAAHRDGMIRVQAVRASEHRVQCRDQVAIVSVRLEIEGVFNGAPASGTFRFTRIWVPTAPGRWQVVAAHSTMISPAAG
ncbi:MAG: nuclear transport factor 2 family protein [Gemmatimonadaceae bacterium]